MNHAVYLSEPGVVCAVGDSRDALWHAVCHADRRGIRRIQTTCGTFYAARVTQPLPEVSARYPMHSIKLEGYALNQIEPYIMAACGRYGKERVAVCVGTCDNGSECSVEGHQYFIQTGSFPAAYRLEMQGADYVASFIGERYGITGPSCAYATACSSSATAFVRASELIMAEVVDAAIVGGVDIASDTVLAGFHALEALSSEPTNPFSRNRSGITLGDAAAFFVLSRDMLSPSAPVIRLAGYGESCDAYHITAPAPNGAGAVCAMNAALAMTGISAFDVGYLNLHGTGTQFNDAMEARAVRQVFDDYAVPCSSTKSMTGHTLGAAGALELAICYEALCRNHGLPSSAVRLPQHVWDGNWDDALPHLALVDKEHSLDSSYEAPRYCMSNSFAFGGANVCLVITED